MPSLWIRGKIFAANSAWLLARFLALAWGEPFFAPHVLRIGMPDAASALSGAAVPGRVFKRDENSLARPPMSSSLKDSPAPGPLGRYRWTICALLFFATTILYIDRQILALLKGTLDKELHWTNEQYGDVMAAFQATYGIGLLAYGWFVDRFGVRIGYALTMAGWSLVAMGHSLVFSVRGFMVARGALGLAESGNFPAAIKAVAQWFPKKERALATAIFNSGANFGPIVAPAVIPFVADKLGWRATFLIVGALGFLWQAAWWRFYDLPERQKRLSAPELAYIRSDADELGGGQKVPWRTVLKYRQTWAFAAAKLLTDPVWWFFLFWLPDYFKAARHLDIKHSWFYLVSIYGLITVLSIYGGWLTGFLVRRGWTVTRARKTGLFIFAVCVTPIYFVTYVGTWAAVLLIGLAGAAHQAWSANLYTTVSDVFPKKAVASVIGIGGLAGSFGGIYFQHFTGHVLDQIKDLHHPTTGYSFLFALCACAYLLSFGLHHLLAPRLEPVNLNEIVQPAQDQTQKLTLFSFRLRRRFLAALLLTLVLSAGAALERWVLKTGIPADATDNFQLMAQAWNIIDSYYVDRPAVRHAAMTAGAINGMTEALGDTNHSVYLTLSEARKAGTAMQGKLNGIGVEIQSRDHQAVVLAPIDGSPAQLAGVRAGDVILQVDGHPVTGMPLSRISARMSGEPGQPISLTLVNPSDGLRREVTVVRAAIKLNNVSWQRLPGTDLAHLRIAIFSEGETPDLRNALLEIKRQGLRGVILDLRNNPGGVLDEAVGTASQFLKSGNVLWEKSAQNLITNVPVQPGGVATDIPLVVLINGASASDSEIVAGPCATPIAPCWWARPPWAPAPC